MLDNRNKYEVQLNVITIIYFNDRSNLSIDNCHYTCRRPSWGRFFTAVCLCFSARYLKQESPLPLTDPRDAEAQRMLNIPYRIIW